MLSFFGKKWVIVVLVTIFVFLLIAFIAAVINPNSEIRLDKHKSYPLFADDSLAGYSRIRAPKREYSADEEICITVSTAFVDSMEQAERLREIILQAQDNPVFDVTFSIGEPFAALHPNAFGLNQKTWWRVVLPHEGVDLEDLIFKRNLFNSVKENDFDFSFQVYFKVKEDAPQNWTGNINLLAYCEVEPDAYGNGVGKICMVDYLHFHKSGNTITIG